MSDIKDYTSSVKSSPKWKKLLRIVSADWEIVRLRSLAQSRNLSWVSLKIKTGFSWLLKISRVLKQFSLRKLSNLTLFVSLRVIYSTISFITVSLVKLKSLIQLSIKSITKYFYRIFLRPSGIAFVCGLEFFPEISEGMKELVVKYPMRLNSLSVPIFAANNSPIEHIKLFLGDLTPRELDQMGKVKILVEGKNMNINDIMDLVRVWVDELFLVKKACLNKVFTVLIHVLTPKECFWLRKKGFKLVYVSSSNTYHSRYCGGLTYGSLTFDKYFLNGLKKEDVVTLVENLYLGEK